MSKDNAAADRQQALNWLTQAGTGAERLRGLLRDFADDAEIPALVAAHPNLPPPMIRELLRYFPEIVRANPATGLYALENPALDVEDLQPATLKKKFQQHAVPGYAIRHYLSAQSRPTVRCIAARHVSLGWLEPLLDDPEPRLRAEIASRDDLPDAWYQRLAHNAPAGVRRALAANPRAASLVAGDDSTPALRRVKVGQAGSAAELKPYVSDGNAGVREAVAGHTRIAAEDAARLAHDASVKVRTALAHNTALPPEVLTLLARDPDEGVRTRLSWQRQLPAEVANILAGDSAAHIRQRVLSHPGLEAQRLQEVLDTGTVYELLQLAHNPALSESQMDRLEQEGGAGVRANLGSNPAISAERALRLFLNPDVENREWIASHPQLRDKVDTITLILEQATAEKSPRGFSTARALANLAKVTGSQDVYQKIFTLACDPAQEFKAVASGNSLVNQMYGRDEILDGLGRHKNPAFLEAVDLSGFARRHDITGIAARFINDWPEADCLRIFARDCDHPYSQHFSSMILKANEARRRLLLRHAAQLLAAGNGSEKLSAWFQGLLVKGSLDGDDQGALKQYFLDSYLQHCPATCKDKFSKLCRRLQQARENKDKTHGSA